MATTIQISEALQTVLLQRKLYDKETYEEVIWDMIEDTITLSEEAKKEIESIHKRMMQGHYHTHEEVKKRLGVK